jgi:hypothetical protein
MNHTNLVIAAWGGKRKNEKPDYLQLTPCGTVNHIAKQITTLNKYKHNLGQVTIVCPPCSDPNPEYSDAIRHMPTKLNNGTKIELLHLDRNVDSYYSYSIAIQQYRDNFDYYICIEDDYVFVENDFDSIMIGMYEEKRDWGCDYLVSYIKDSAIITNGIVASKILHEKNYVAGGSMRAFFDSFVFGKFRDEYGLSPYFCSKGIIYFGSGKYLLVPTQMVNDDGNVIPPNNILLFEEITHDMSASEVLEFLGSLH